MKESIDNKIEKFDPEKISVNLENQLSLIKGHGILSGHSLLRQYKFITSAAKRKIAEEEIIRYITALYKLTDMDDERKHKEMSHGVREIIQDAEAGRRSRIDPSETEMRKAFTQTELEDFKKNQNEENKEEQEEKDLIENIQEKYKKLFKEEKQ